MKREKAEHEMNFHRYMSEWHKQKMYECKDRMKMLRNEKEDAEVME